MQTLPDARNFTKEKVTQKQYLRVAHTYGLIEEKFPWNRENKTKKQEK